MSYHDDYPVYQCKKCGSYTSSDPESEEYKLEICFLCLEEND
mgnify:CR=1 FL=1